MNMDVDEAYWADWFWTRAGEQARYPVDIGYAATCALEVSIHQIADLTPAAAADFLGHGERAGAFDNRPLHGCIAFGPQGATIIVEREDAEDERRFTIAHEVSHYILEVRRHHRRAEWRMGGDYVGVLYGSREATPTERIDAWLNNVQSAPTTHFMDRTSTGGYGCGRTLEAECAADRLAIEILAPRAELASAVSAHRKLPFRALLDKAQRIAERRFGLPAAVAEPYATRLVWRLTRGPSTAERFGLL